MSMSLTPEQHEQIKRFTDQADIHRGLLALDLDGTVLLEQDRRTFISSSVEKGVKAVHDMDTTIVINTLRFPLSVIWTVGEAWYQIVDTPILTVLLNGSVLGYIRRGKDGLEYDELQSFPMTQEEVSLVVNGLEQLIHNGIQDVLLFYYTRNWRAGETLWTPQAHHIEDLRKRYRSASSVISTDVQRLRESLKYEDVCMMFIQIDRPKDKLMAYQHAEPEKFITHEGVDKAFGIRKIAEHFHLSLPDSFGAGDTVMDSFLSELGMAVIVGDSELPYRGKIETARVRSPIELGDVIIAVGQLVKQKRTYEHKASDNRRNG